MRRVWPLLRALLGFGVAAWLIWTVLHAPGVDLPLTLRSSDRGLLAAAVAVYFVGYPLMVARWSLLLNAQKLDINLPIMLRLLMIGNFFNLVVPGAVGGDVAKASGLAGQTAGRRVEALLTIFVDRVLGAVGLLLLSALSITYSYSFLREADGRIAILALIFGLTGIAAVLSLWALVWRDRWGHLAAARAARHFVMRVLPEKVANVAQRAVRSLDVYRDVPAVLISGVVLSVLIHGVATVVIILLARAIGENTVTIPQYFLAVQLANAAGMLPITPGGIGGRDLVMFILLSHAGATASQAGTIPVLYSAIVTLYGLLGGAVFVVSPVRAIEEPV